jgi:multiple sugar transport system substrate-binding protein
MIGFDHVARLINAPRRDPDQWVMMPAPRGPAGRGFMVVLSGLAIPRGAQDTELAHTVIATLSKPEVQVELLRANAFFPTVRATLPGDLPPAIRLEADAIERQRSSAGAILSLPPVGLGTREGEVTKVFRDCFQSIVLAGGDVRSTLDSQGRILDGLLDDIGAPCWAPDPPSGTARCGVA